MGTWHIDETFDLFGKLGAAFGKLDVDYEPSTKSDSEHRTMPLIALGAGYNFTPAFGAQLMWEHLFGNSDADRFNSVDSFMLGLKYTFEI